MTRLVRFANNATSKLAANLSSVGLTMSVTPGDGAKFPTLTAGQFFKATLVKSDGTKEVVKVTARATDTMTMVRANEAVGGVQTAYAFSAGDKVELRLTATALGDELDRLDAAAFLDVVNKSANYTIVEADVSKLIKTDTTAGNVTITLPQISTLTGSFEVQVSKNTGDANTVNVVRSGTDTINGLTSYNLSAQYQCVWLVADLATNTWTAITSASASNRVTDLFTGSGTAGPFTLSGDPGSKNNTDVFVGGVYQNKSTYTVAGTQLTLGGNVGAGVGIEVNWSQPLAIGAPSDGTVTTPKLAAVIAPTVSSLNSGQLAGLRNKVINGKMDIAQRGASFPAIAVNAFATDRWQVGASALASVVTVAQQADVPASNEFNNSLRTTVTTADASITDSKFLCYRQRIEGFNVRDLIGKTFTLSFWVRSSKTGVHCIGLTNYASDRSYVAEYSIVAANIWEYKTVTVAGGLITAGTWDWATGAGLSCNWALAAGTSFQTTPNAWKTGNFLATASQVNCLDTVGNIFAITGVQLEVGSVATPFEHRPFGAELALCQRYCYRWSAPASGFGAVGAARGASSTASVAILQLPVTMRSAPSMTYSASSTFNVSGAGVCSGISTNDANINEVRIVANVASGAALNAAYTLEGNTSAAYVIASAEL